MVIEHVRQMSVEEFLDFAEGSEYRYEYIDGEPIEMTGGKLNHFDIISNILFELRLLLVDTDCRTLPNGMLVRVGEASLVAPDVSVVSGEPETEADTRILRNPVLVGEVTSPTTVSIDRGVKRDYYFDVPSIEIYLVVDQQRLFVELHTRGDRGWRIDTYFNIDDEIPLEALACRLPLRDIYRNIMFDDESAARSSDKDGD